MKQLSERQAWKVGAEAYYTPRGERDKKQANITGLNDIHGDGVSGDGICEMLWSWSTKLPISSKNKHKMKAKITDDYCSQRDVFGDGHDIYFCDPTNPANDLLRADFCMLECGGV